MMSSLAPNGSDLMLNLEPVVSILLAQLLLDETLNNVQLSGVILVIAVVILSLRFKPATA